ncbi:methionyl-tRNA formyltransferase [Candidatus Nomurabacteria bacterium RIFCSPLOWO2_01_FULL_42_20]|nr:MAG: methionyl-tRNA formyltransferase [Candidatus Nomurabacteria bacterium RIFCSPLOWO2_01_FULL_42_20]
MNKINFVFFGTPQIAVDTLEILKSHSFLPSLVVTAPDKPAGRKMIMTPPPVKTWAEKNNILFLQPEKLDENFKKLLSTNYFLLSIVVAYGKIFPEWLINLPKLGTLNIHYSLLPKYRGASPVQAAILNGDTETGVTIQKMVRELDAGPIVAQEKTEISPDEKTPELLERLTKIGAKLLTKILNQVSQGLPLTAIEQDESQVTLAPKIKKEDGLLTQINADSTQINADNYNKFRAFYDWPRVYFLAPRSPSEVGMKDGKRIIITEATLENGRFVIKKILPEGKKETNYKIF